MLIDCQLHPWGHILLKYFSKSTIFTHDNELENAVCEMAAILSGPQCVNMTIGKSWLRRQEGS